jgi:hypothetical protein
MIKWLHHLFNPHCAECKADNECPNCALLMSLIAQERYEKQQLIDRLLPQKENLIPQEQPTKQFVSPGHIPWRVRREALEREDREIAKSKEKAAKPDSKIIGSITTETLEKDLLDNV